MRTKKVNRYWCDFCNRASLQAACTRKHESRCTLNPGRVCGMCAFIGVEQTPLHVLIGILPDPATHKRVELDISGREVWHSWDGLEAAVDRVLPQLRDAAHDCPACILAAIRQRGIPAPEITSFKFKDEMKALLDERNGRDYEEEMRSEYRYG